MAGKSGTSSGACVAAQCERSRRGRSHVERPSAKGSGMVIEPRRAFRALNEEEGPPAPFGTSSIVFGRWTGAGRSQPGRGGEHASPMTHVGAQSMSRRLSALASAVLPGCQ
eukprot:5755926-Prymnesium_polylepis.1